ARYAQLRSFAAKNSHAVEIDREKSLRFLRVVFPRLQMGLRRYSPFTRRVLHFDPLTGRKRVITLGNASLGIGRGERQFERLLKILLFLAYFPPKLFVLLFRFPVEVRGGVLFPKSEVMICHCLLEYDDQ